VDLQEQEKIGMRVMVDLELLKNEYGFYNAGSPNFDRPFGRDSEITAWQLLPVNPVIARNTLAYLARYQGREVNWRREEEPGKIIHEHYPNSLVRFCISLISGWGFPYYGSVDSTPLFVVLAGLYFHETLNKQFIERIWPNIERALIWMTEYGDSQKDGFLRYERKNPYGLLNQGWKDSGLYYIEPPVAIVEAQGYAYLAYLQAGVLAAILGESDKAKELKNKAEELKKRFNQAFWMPEEQYFALALDGKQNQIRDITSNPGHLLFTGIVDEEKIPLVVSRLFAEDMWTPYGIRTLSVRDPKFEAASYHMGSGWPHDNWMIYKGLVRCGYKKEAGMVKEASLRVYKEFNYSIPELYVVTREGKLRKYPKACPLQAWALGAVLNWILEN
jgi:glycogen debranching enzyme